MNYELWFDNEQLLFISERKNKWSTYLYCIMVMCVVYLFLKLFSDMNSVNKWKIGSWGFLSHLNNAAGDFRVRRSHNNRSTSWEFRWGVAQHFNSIAEITGFCWQHIDSGVSPHQHKLLNLVIFLHWHLPCCLLLVWLRFLTLRYSTGPLAHRESCGGSPAVL